MRLLIITSNDLFNGNIWLFETHFFRHNIHHSDFAKHL